MSKFGGLYVSKWNRQYDIIPTSNGFFKIKGYNGGELHKDIGSLFTSYRQAESALIAYLRRTDKFNRAIYPGCLSDTRCRK